MASIKSLEMATAFSSIPCITIKKSLFGVKAVYEPTQSPVEVQILEYAPAEGERLERLLKLPLADLAAEVQKKGKPAPTPVGHHRLELCFSKDRQFAALQLFAFVDFKYHAVSDFLFYEGADAQAVMVLFDK